jgi:DNA-binding MarR family transcriptional regulator
MSTQPIADERMNQVIRIEGALTTINRIINGRLADTLRMERSGVLLGKPRMNWLRTLYERGPMRVVDLGTINYMDKGYASRTWRSLEADGYIEVVPGDDPRATTVALTAKGVEVYVRWRDVNTSLVADTLESWDGNDLDVLTAVLERLVGSLRELPVRSDVTPSPHR